MIFKLLLFLNIINQIYLNQDFIIKKLNICDKPEKNIIVNNHKQFDNFLYEKKINKLKDNIKIIKNNFYVIGRLNNCFFRMMPVYKFDKIYLLEECKEKIKELNEHKQYFSSIFILNILNINIKEWNIYILSSN